MALSLGPGWKQGGIVTPNSEQLSSCAVRSCVLDILNRERLLAFAGFAVLVWLSFLIRPTVIVPIRLRAFAAGWSPDSRTSELCC